MQEGRQVLPIIVLAQFCCTSLWFAGNGVMADLARTFVLPVSALGNLTAFVQFGFIVGTLIFALLNLADRYAPAWVFFLCAVVGALFNAATIWEGHALWSLLALRFAVGFSLAGIYPVGMKIAADHFQKGLGVSLGYLVGALVVGTAFPHLLKALTGAGGLPWRLVLLLTSALAILGGLALLWLVPNGPYRKPGQQLQFGAFFKVFRNRAFRAAAFGYFGHMWELYAFWAFLPVLLLAYDSLHPGVNLSISLWCFLIIGIGGIACVLGGYLAQRKGTKWVAGLALSLSGICCLSSPLFFLYANTAVFLGFLLFWGMVVIADSPLFSTMVAQHAAPEIKGTALTIVNNIGFTITIVSIQLLSWWSLQVEVWYLFLILALGPLLGLFGLYQPLHSQAPEGAEQ